MKRFTTPSSKKTDKITGMKLKHKFSLISFLLLGVIFVLRGGEFIKPERVRAEHAFKTDVYVYQINQLGSETIKCNLQGNCINEQNQITINVSISADGVDDLSNLSVIVQTPNMGLKNKLGGQSQLTKEGTASIPINLTKGTHTIRIILEIPGSPGPTYLDLKEFLIGVSEFCTDAELNKCKITQNDVSLVGDEPYALCNQVKSESINECVQCTDSNGVWTALGCIYTDSTNIIQTLTKIGLLIGGGITLLIILAGSFILTISQGDPKKTSEAKEMITSAIIGLIFIIFSVSILQLIGVDILRIPQFGESTKVPLPVILK